MAAAHFAGPDYAVLIGFLVLSAGIGVFVAWRDRRNKSNKRFLTGNKELDWFPVSMSMVASFLPSIAILGVPVEVFVHGSTIWIGIICSSCSILVATYVFLPMYYKMDITSINEYLEKRFKSTVVRNIASAVFIVETGLYHLGGFGNMWTIAGKGGRVIITNFSTSPYDTYTTWNVVLGWATMWLVTYCVNQTQVQRYCSMKSLKRARRALLLNIPFVVGTLLVTVVAGLTLYAVYGDCDPRLTGDIDKADQLMPYIVQDLLRYYPGLSGLFVASVFSASLSTLSSGYNAMAAVTWDDFVRPRITMSEAGAIAAAYGFLSISVAFLTGTMESIVQASQSMVGALCGPLLAIFMLGTFFPCCKRKGALAGILVGIAMSSWLALGSIVYPRDGDDLPSSTAGCTEFNQTLTAGSFAPPPRPRRALAALPSPGCP
ncbi:sodium-coupled monocarboxylate transporter 1-like [Amblyomma americanum]